MTAPHFQIACSDAIEAFASEHWDRVVAHSGLFLSREYLRMLEAHAPEPLSMHYAMIFMEARPVAVVVAQSLDIRVADLSGHLPPPLHHGPWPKIGKASRRTLDRARNQLLLYDSLLLWPFESAKDAQEDEGELWPEMASELWHRFRILLQATEHLIERGAESAVAWVHLRFLVCGSLLSTGPHGVAFVEGEDPAILWPGVLQALQSLRRLNKPHDTPNMTMIKDLTTEQHQAESVLLGAGYSRFDTEPNMVLPLKPSWSCYENYLQDMKSSYRSDIQKTLQQLDTLGVVLERLSPADAEVHASEIHHLYLQVHDRQKLRLSTITPGWIPALAGAYQDSHRCVVARMGRGGPILGFITVLRDGHRAVGTWIGFDKTLAASGLPLYRSLLHAGIAQAIDMGASSLTLGRTALEPKAQIGAEPEAMYGYLRHRSPALNLIVPSILALLPEPQTMPERHPFKTLRAVHKS